MARHVTPPHRTHPEGPGPSSQAVSEHLLSLSVRHSCSPPTTPSFRLSPSHRHQPHKPLPPSSPQTPPKADSQFSASLPGAGKPETAQVGMDVCSPPAPPALTVSKPRRTFPVPHCLPGLCQQTPSLGPRSGPATQGALAGVGVSLV